MSDAATRTKSKPPTSKGSAAGAAPTSKEGQRPSVVAPPVVPPQPSQEDQPPATQVEGGVTLTIRVISAKNIKGAKGDRVNSFVRVQFADFDYKESPVFSDSPHPEYNFEMAQQFHVDETLVDMFANKKLHFTLIESLPKDKTAVLGDADLSMYHHFLKYPSRDPNAPDAPLLFPNLSFRETVPITYVNPRLLVAPPSKNEPEDANKLVPEFEIEVSLSQPLIPPEVVENGNFLFMKVEDAFPVPDEWTLKEGMEKDLNSNIFTYTLNLMMPAASSSDRLVIIPNGTLTTTDAPITYDPSAPASQPILMPKPQTSNKDGTTPAGAGKTGAAEKDQDQGGSAGEDTTVTSAPPAPVEKAEKVGETRKIVSWNVTHVIWIPPDAVVGLREKIQNKQPLEIEFVRELQPRFSHVQDTNVNKYRGRSILDLSSLLFPRVIGLRGRFPLDNYEPPPSPSEPAPLAATATAMSSTLTVDATPAPKGKTGKGSDLNVYKSLGTSMGLELLLEKPLLNKKKLQPISKSVRDFIPRRVIPPHMLYEKKSRQADDEYRGQIQELVKSLVKEYQNVMGGGQTGDDKTNGSDEQQRRKKFLFHLNRSGAYFAFKEHLKEAVVEVVRERFKMKSPFATKSELQLFMSEIYVYLVDQMHIAINKVFHDKAAAFVDPTITKTADFQLLKKFADTAERDHSISIAASYHQERVAKYEDSMQACLLAYGAICSMNERFEEARVYFVTAVELQPKYVLALTLLGIFYEITSEEEESEKYLQEAAELQKATTSAGAPSIHMLVAEFCLQCHAGQFAERALAQELIQFGPKVKPYLMLSQLEIQRRNYTLAEGHIRDALNVQQDDTNAWAALGNLQFIQKQWNEAQLSYETVLSLQQEPNDMDLVYIRLGSLYLRNATSSTGSVVTTPAKANLDMTFARMAKTMYLRACEINPTAQSWLGAGKVCFALGDYEEAEDALAEANVLNNRDSEVWANLALLCLSLERYFEANQCIAQALRLGIRNADVLRAVGIAFMTASQHSPAVECFRMCLELEPDREEVRELFKEALNIGSRTFLDEREQSEQKGNPGEWKGAAKPLGPGVKKSEMYSATGGFAV
ncbi:Cilia- and flagella-associated protein 70 [Borealophlyctis nickersoniae]|nr:Cilia- and flagella-associated protein 70 [Borealophlyctis nickersoniae]